MSDRGRGLSSHSSISLFDPGVPAAASGTASRGLAEADKVPGRASFATDVRARL